MFDTVSGNYYILLDRTEAPVKMYDYWQLYDFKENRVFYMDEIIILHDMMRVQ